MGGEFELATATLLAGERGLTEPEKKEIVARIGAAMQRQGLPYIGSPHNMFTPYFRYYEDVGAHVEVAMTPSVSPFELVRREGQAFKLVRRALERVRMREPGLVLAKNNKCYVSGFETWSAHESYGVYRDFRLLKKALLPFLVTRQCLCGNGGLVNRRFWLSQRAEFISEVANSNTTFGRPLFGLRNEPLMQNSRLKYRWHNITGCSLMSETGEALRFGTTQLVLFAAQEDATLGGAVKFEDPVASYKKLSETAPDGLHIIDPHLIRVQRHYLHATGRWLEKSENAPPWCARIWKLWSSLLDMLEEDPMLCSTILDPYIKMRLYSEFLRQRGKRWQDLEYNQDLYWELALMDFRYHSLADGLFDELEAAGALNHRLFSDAETEPGNEPEPYVVEAPPRERARARLIKQYSGQRHVDMCWGAILDSSAGRHAPLEDPFSEKVVWKDLKRPSAS